VKTRCNKVKKMAAAANNASGNADAVKDGLIICWICQLTREFRRRNRRCDSLSFRGLRPGLHVVTRPSADWRVVKKPQQKDSSVVFARLRQCAPHLIHAFLAHPSPHPKHFDGLSPSAQLTTKSHIVYNRPSFLPSKLPLRTGIWTPSNTKFLGPTQVHKPNDMSIGSAVFAGLTIVTDRQTDRPRYSVCKNRPHLWCGLIVYCNTAARSINGRSTDAACYGDKTSETAHHPTQRTPDPWTVGPKSNMHRPTSS